jgi:uncharacterized protein
MSAGERKKNTAAIHGVVFFATLIVVTAGFPSLPWPWYLVIPLLVYGGVVSAVGPLRRTLPKLVVGRLGGMPLACAAVLAVITTSVLMGFHALICPDVKDLAAKLPMRWFGNLLLAGVFFSVMNAAIEELIFRGILWEVVSDEWSNGVALCVTSLLFGLGHLRGYPPGLFGAILAAIYGITLGLLRWWTGGLGLGTACHVCADATIFYILAGTGALDAT